MPATAGRVRMPANNRVHSSAALQTHGIWQSAIGYDPYAPAADKSKGSKPDMDPGNAYASFRDLITLARFTITNTNETRGACKKCGRVGHLTFQCRNFLILKDDRPPPAAAAENDDSTLKTAKYIFEKIKKKDEIGSEDGDDEDDEISSSDSDVDLEMERIIAERFGRPLSKKAEILIKKRKKRSNLSESDDEEERRKKRKHRLFRRRHRKSDDDLDSDRHRRHKWRRRAKETDSDSSSSRESDRQRSRGGSARIGDRFCQVGRRVLVRAQMTMRGGKGGGRSGAEGTGEKGIDSILSVGSPPATIYLKLFN